MNEEPEQPVLTEEKRKIGLLGTLVIIGALGVVGYLLAKMWFKYKVGGGAGGLRYTVTDEPIVSDLAEAEVVTNNPYRIRVNFGCEGGTIVWAENVTTRELVTVDKTVCQQYQNIPNSKGMTVTEIWITIFPPSITVIPIKPEHQFIPWGTKRTFKFDI